jgi:hypothetical protein
MANSLIDIIQSLDKTLQKRFDVLIPFGAKKPTSAQAAQTQETQSGQVITQPFPDYHSGTMEVKVNPFTGAVEIPPKVFPPYGGVEIEVVPKDKKSSPKTTSAPKAVAPTKKALTVETLTSEGIPLLPYTPEGLLRALKQGKMTSAQLQQFLAVTAPQNLSLENLFVQLKNEIDKLPEEIKSELMRADEKVEKLFNMVQENLNKQVAVQAKYADQEINLMREHLNLIKDVFLDLMKEKPRLEPDKWTQFGRQLAMALGAITALAHPGYAPYFYMAIPQVVQYWQNEDAQNFERAIKKFEMALTLAGTQMDFYNQLMEHNLKILEKQREKELLPLTMTSELLLTQYTNYMNLYTKMALEYYKTLSDKIGNLISLADLANKARHYRNLEELKEKELKLREKELAERARYRQIMAGLRQKYLDYLNKKLGIELDIKQHPEKYPGVVKPKLISKASSLEQALKLFKYSEPWEHLEEFEDELP